LEFIDAIKFLKDHPAFCRITNNSKFFDRNTQQINLTILPEIFN